MLDDKRRESQSRPLKNRGVHSAPLVTVLLPIVVAAVLCAPCLTLGYLWDDYYFLTGGERGDYAAYFLPSPHAVFYRPVPQGFYFLLLRILDPTDGTFAHVLNLSLLACTIGLCVLLVSELSGRRAGLLSGLLLASYGLAPSLVAWVSCSQDLLATALVLAAFLLRHRGRNMAALVTATLALLCKEPAIAAFPVLVFWDRLVGRPAQRLTSQLGPYLAVALLWAIVHPGIRLLAVRGFQSGASGYVGLEHPERWGRYFVRYLLTLVNLPPPGIPTSWWKDRVEVGLIALLITILGAGFLLRRTPADSAAGSATRTAVIASLFALPTVLLPTFLIRHWAPYFAFLPAVGLAVAIGPFLARCRTVVSLLVLSVFLMLGIRYRGLQPQGEPIWAERVFVDASHAVQVVRANFKTILPAFPRGSQVVTSVSSTGVRGIYSTLIDGQALRVWYREPTLHTVPTLRRLPGAPSEFLVRVTSDLDVIYIDPDSRRIEATTRYAPDLSEIGRPIVNYARALAAAGDVGRALRILQGLARSTSGTNVTYVTRLCAMVLLADGRRIEAESLLTALPPLPRDVAFEAIRPVITEPSASEQLDDAAFEAFGLSSSDPETLRWVMREFGKAGSLAQAAWYAQRMVRIIPLDAEAQGVLHQAAKSEIQPRRVT